MVSLKQLISGINFSPKIEINKNERLVYIKEGMFFNHITETYYIIKGYSIQRR